MRQMESGKSWRSVTLTRQNAETRIRGTHAIWMATLTALWWYAPYYSISGTLALMRGFGEIQKKQGAPGHIRK